ncbi:MAG TPA: hypothetical protein DCG04_17705 [Rhodospirillaceae bacterium]|nr:hypothetical protein [Rhodospirillaceae bacterium]
MHLTYGRNSLRSGDHIVVVACFVLIFIPLWILPVLMAILCGVAMLMGGLARSKLGGVTGDSLGATEQISEITCLIILAILLGT